MELLIAVLVLFPCFSCAAFISCLLEFVRTPKADVELRKKNRSSLITASIVLGVNVAVLASLFLFAMLAIGHM